MARRTAVTDRDLRTMLGIAAATAGDDAAEPLPWSVLVGLRELIPCDEVGISMFDARERVFHLSQKVGVGEQISDDRKYELGQAFFDRYWESPSCNYPDVSGVSATASLRSDFLSLRQLRTAPMYCEHSRYFGIDVRSMMLCLPSQPGRVLRLRFCRGPGSDFSPRDRDLATLMRPHIYAAYCEQRRRRHPRPRLTSRQEQLLGLVAAGYTNGQIGRRLSISEATVRKHLEHVFERMRVTSRTAAVTAYLAAEESRTTEPGEPLSAERLLA